MVADNTTETHMSLLYFKLDSYTPDFHSLWQTQISQQAINSVCPKYSYAGLDTVAKLYLLTQGPRDAIRNGFLLPAKQ